MLTAVISNPQQETLVNVTLQRPVVLRSSQAVHQACGSQRHPFKAVHVYAEVQPHLNYMGIFKTFSNVFLIKLIPTWGIFPFSICLLFSLWHEPQGLEFVLPSVQPQLLRSIACIFFSCPCKIPLQITLIPHSLIKIIFLAKLALVKNTEFCYEVQSVPCLS